MTISANPQEKINKQQNYSENMFHVLESIWGATKRGVNWIDSKGPLMTTLATITIAVLTGIYVHYSRAQWKVMSGQLVEMKKTTEASKVAAEAAQSSAQLNWQIMRSSNAAALAPRIGTNVADPVALAYGLSISFNNGGKVPAKNFRCEATMTRQTVPGYRTIGHTQRIAFGADQVRPWAGANSYGPAETVYGKFELSSFTDRDMQSIHDMHETVEIEGTFQYEDGFQNTVKESFCFLNLRVHNVAGNFNEGWFPCVEGKVFADETLKYRARHPETK